MQVHGLQVKIFPLRLSLECQRKKPFYWNQSSREVMLKRMWQRITLWTCGPGFSAVAHNVLPWVQNPFTCTSNCGCNLVIRLYQTSCIAPASGMESDSAQQKHETQKKYEIVRDQKQANYISINWHCKNNTSANHQALEKKTSTQFQSPPSPQNTAYYIEQLRRPHFYNLAHGNRTSVLIHSSHAWLRVHEPNPLWHCKKRKR